MEYKHHRRKVLMGDRLRVTPNRRIFRNRDDLRERDHQEYSIWQKHLRKTVRKYRNLKQRVKRWE